jgi:hypothetical protein
MEVMVSVFWAGEGWDACCPFFAAVHVLQR